VFVDFLKSFFEGDKEMSIEKEGKFKVIKITKLEDLQDKTVKELPESDLTIQTSTHIVQFKYNEEDSDGKKYTIKPGCHTMVESSSGIFLQKFKLRDYTLLKTIDNTSTIISERDRFFDNLNVYKELKREPKRAILLCSPPGVGKSSAINEVCKSSLQKEGTCVIIWDTSDIRANSVNKFFLNRSEFDKDVKRLIMVIEDIEGGTVEDDYSPRAAASSLLNLLDGVGSPFKGVPTFIIATTNNPEKSVGALIDRPGRFDKVIEMKTPGKKEMTDLLKFIIEKKKLTQDEEIAANLAAENEFSIAHIQEAVVRSKLDDISIKEAVEELIRHKKRFKEAFSKAPKRSMGLG
jgi:hypothetical protein